MSPASAHNHAILEKFSVRLALSCAIDKGLACGMPNTITNLLRRGLGPDTWLGRALRMPADFLLRHAVAEMRRETNALREEMAVLRGDMARLHANFVNRASNLEALLLEHPKAHTGNPAVLSRIGSAFPSPAVSIVMPTWNRAGVVGEAIESVLAQGFADWELIVVDDGSADNTEEVVAAFADPRIHYRKMDHAGQCAARNHALRLAKGALVAYLDSDNIWYPDFLTSAVTAFAADPSIASAYGAMVSEMHLPEGQRLLFAPFDREALLKGNFIGISSFVHRRGLYERFGGFDETLSRLVDWDLILRYTQETPARRLPVLAVRIRRMDDKRVTDTVALTPNHEKIVGKWRLA